MNHKPSWHNQYIAEFVLVSIIIHSALVLVLIYKKIEPPVVERQQTVEVEFVEPPPVPKVETKVAQKVEPPPPPAKTPLSEQVVEQLEKANNTKDETTMFLGAHDQKVEKQTKAKATGEHSNKQKSRPIAEALEIADTLPDLSAQFTVKKEAENSGPAQSDHLRDIEEGKQTILSTRQFGYFNYYTGIKERIRQRWEPTVRAKIKVLYREGRSIASASDSVTQLLVTLNEQGGLISVEILKPSGEGDLDRAAVEAFHSAAPFPDPPPGLVEPDGTIKIRWDFVLEI